MDTIGEQKYKEEIKSILHDIVNKLEELEERIHQLEFGRTETEV